MSNSPADRYRLPAEWEAQDAVLLSWPPGPGYWESTIPLAEVEATFASLAAAISQQQRVLLITPETADGVEAALERAGAVLDRISRVTLPADDVWARDFGPLAVRRDSDGALALLDFTFNGWGGKYPAAHDNAVTRALAAGGHVAAPVRTIPRVLEGGSIDVDGAGAMLTTRECLLTPTRNADMTEADWTAALCDWFGVDTVHWLSYGRIAGDDTDGHVDMLARFAPGGIILHATCTDPDDPHFTWLTESTAELAGLRRPDGEPYLLVGLPIPPAILDGDDKRLPASYANFLVINDAVLVPTYRAPDHDAAAIAAIAAAFPGRRAVGIDCLPLIHQFGSLHCVTMQLPTGVLPCPAS